MNTLILCLLYLTSNLLSAQNKGLEIAQEVSRRDSGWKDQVVSSKMILHAPNENEVVRNIRSKSIEVENDGDKAIFIFDEPHDVKGTVFLTFSHKKDDDEQWLYLPALSRVKRIPSANRSGPFMGSEFAYEDISSEEIEKSTYNYLREEACAEKLKCFVVEKIPLDSNSGYSKQIVWVDKNEYRIHKVEFYNKKNEHLKTLTLSDFKKYENKFWRPLKWEMDNHITKKKTDMIWGNFQFKTGLTQNDFDQNALKRIK